MSQKIYIRMLVFSVPVTAYEDPLHDAAKSFVELLDAGSFQQTWWEGSELLHLTTNLDQWVDMMRVHLDLLGRLEERSVWSVIGRQSLAGFPDGELCCVCHGMPI